MKGVPSNSTVERPTGDSPRRPRHDPIIWLVTGLGVGLVSPAPGTFGALWGLLLAWGLAQLRHPILAGGIVMGLIVIGVPLCTWAARKLGGKDPQAIVWDELTTLPIVFWFVPLTSWKVAVTGFLLHRVCDISKPWPCRQLERLPEGLGIMADDVMAGIYAGAVLWGSLWLWG